MNDLRTATWPEVDAAQRRLLVVPVGSLEQHGPHLPLDTDGRVAEALARAFHDRHPAVGLAPLLPIGASGEHAGFPGTLSIGAEALATVVVELVRDAAETWRHVLVVNGHGGNVEALRRAQRVCAYEKRSLTVVHAGVPGGDAHAGRTETSLLLHLAPSLVRLDRAEAGRTEPVAELMEDLRRDGVRAVSPNGVLGDPAGASADEGATLFAAMLDRLEAAAADLL